MSQLLWSSFVKVEHSKLEALVFISKLCMNPSCQLKASETRRACVTARFCKTLFLGHDRALHTPQLCPTRLVLPPGLPSLLKATWQVWSQEHLCRVGMKDAGPGKTQTVVLAWGVEGVCRGVAWKAGGGSGAQQIGVVASPIRSQEPGVQSRERCGSRLVSSSHKLRARNP